MGQHRALPVLRAHLLTIQAARSAGIAQATHSPAEEATTSLTVSAMRVTVGPMVGRVHPALWALTKPSMARQNAALVREASS